MMDSICGQNINVVTDDKLKSLNVSALEDNQNVLKTRDLFVSIAKVLSAYRNDWKRGKEVKNYTIVFFNNEVILCKNCIHDLFLRIIGGRRNKVGDKLSSYFKSPIYRGNQTQEVLEMSKKGLVIEGYTEKVLWTMMSDYTLMNRYSEVSDEVKGKYLEDFQVMIGVFKQKDSTDEKLKTTIEAFENEEDRANDVGCFKPLDEHRNDSNTYYKDYGYLSGIV